MKEAMLYKKFDDQKVKCAVCSHRCVIKEGNRGICRVRENQAGVLYALNYGKAVAANIDPIEKKPLYHFLPKTKAFSIGTEGCNMKCSWCQNWRISQSPEPDEAVNGRKLPPEDVVEQALNNNCKSIAYTYTEPTIFLEYALDTMKIAHKKGLKNIWVSNGYMTKETLAEIIPYLDAANIDYKGPSELYKKYTGTRLEPVKENLKYLYQAGVHLEVTTLVIPGLNDKKEQLEEIAHFIAEELGNEVVWHVSRFYPGWKMQDTARTPIDTIKIAKSIGEKAGLKYVHMGNV